MVRSDRRAEAAPSALVSALEQPYRANVLRPVFDGNCVIVITEGEPPVCRRRTRFGSEGTASLLGNGEARMEGKHTDKSLMGNVKKASC